MMAMADVLDYLPADHEAYDKILKMFQDLSSSVMEYRDDSSKLWYQVIDKQDSAGNYLEASASLMFIYSFAKGANNKHLDSSYFDTAAESFDSVFSRLITIDDDSILTLNNVCSVSGLGGKPYRDGSFSYYISEPVRPNDFKGYGPLLLAAIQLNKKNK
jgi:unsaturated rhamnogalacturonyl hydrolase